MNLLRISSIISIVLLIFSCTEPVPRPVVRIVPLPKEVNDQKGIFKINSATRIEISADNDQLRQIASVLNSHINNFYGITNEIVNSESASAGSIFLKVDENLKMGKEDYYLNVSSKGIFLEAAASNGLFYGVQTLLQLLPPTPKQSQEIIVPAVEIKDSPRFSWRGLHLDVSRHFMPKEFILKYLDYMAMHKLNTFHWHLADDQGWRIESMRYPRLTEIGSVRKKTVIGHIENTIGFDTIPTGGFYTQRDVREIVRYASDRFITVVPGIEMPGHALAALAAYPELGCTGVPYEVATRWGTFSDVYCPGKEETFTFLRNLLTELTPLFPGKYFDIGGAECSDSQWERCKNCQLRIKTDSLNSTRDLHNYFVRRMSGILDSLGKDMVGWDDFAKDTLLTKGVVTAWHGEDKVISSTRHKHQTVVSPAKFCNFDQYQFNPRNEPLAVGGLLTLEQVYNFEPIPDELSDRDARYIIGAQANVWTQYMKTPEYVEYMLFPRIAALAEVVWSSKSSRNYRWFRKRMDVQIKRYDAIGIKYCKEEFKTPTN